MLYRLYASKERLKAGQKLWLEKVQALSNSLMILVHTTAPPPLRKTQSVDSTYSSNRHSSSSAHVCRRLYLYLLILELTVVNQSPTIFLSLNRYKKKSSRPYFIN